MQDAFFPHTPHVRVLVAIMHVQYKFEKRKIRLFFLAHISQRGSVRGWTRYPFRASMKNGRGVALWRHVPKMMMKWFNKKKTPT